MKKLKNLITGIKGLKILTVGIIILLILPFFVTNPFVRDIILTALFGITLATGFNIIAGYGGQLSLGHAGFVGLGAYSSYWFVNSLPMFKGSPIGLIFSFIFGGVVALAIAFPVGYVLLRMRGIYFALGTLAFSEVILGVFKAIPTNSFWGGVTGVPLMQGFGSDLAYIYTMGFVAIAAIVTEMLIAESKFGLGLKALRGAHDKAKASGINVHLEKMKAFSISAFFVGTAGSIWTYYYSFINPAMVFSATLSLRMQVMAIFGGLGSIMGPIIGGMIIEPLRKLLTVYVTGIPALHLLVYGVILIVVVLYSPEGLWKRIRSFLPDELKEMGR